MTHTSGPWEGGIIRDRDDLRKRTIEQFVEHTTGPFGVIQDAKNQTIAFIGVTPDTVGEDEANANLIAAAPDMLEALEGLVARIDEVTWDNNQLPPTTIASGVATARAAIKKAKS